MFMVASNLLGLAPGVSVMVGDKESDLLAASRAGVSKGFLVDSGMPQPFVDVIKYLRANSR
jgi:histidinol phosphatase-like enzyme